MPTVLYTASTFSHIANFHLPYLRRFQELGWRVEVACGGAYHDIPCADEVLALPLEKKMTAPANFRAAAMLRRRMAQRRYDLVITHTALASFFTRWAAKGLRCRPTIINVVHGYLFDDETGSAKKAVLTAAEKLTARETDLLLTMNEWDARWAVSHNAGKKVMLISGMGVDESRFEGAVALRREKRRELGLAESDVALVYPAEFSTRKNQAMLLRALPQLPQNVKLLLPGQGALWEDCKALAETLGVASRVVFPGQVGDIPSWLAAADIAVTSSRSEGLPFNVMEAMLCALPTVGSRVKGHTDLIEDGKTGRLFPYDDADSFVKAVLPLIEDEPLRRCMGEAAKVAAAPYTLQNTLPTVMEAYLSAVDGDTKDKG